MPHGATITITRIGDKYYLNYHQDEQNWAIERGTEDKTKVISKAIQFMTEGM